MVRVGSPIDSSSAICSDASRDALARAPGVAELGCRPGHADGQRDLVPGRAAQLAQLREAALAVLECSVLVVGGTQHGAGGDAHRHLVGVVVGQRVGDLSGALPAEPGRVEIAVG